MKKRIFYLLIMVLLFQIPLMSQTVVWEENFNVPPSGWSLEGNWSFTVGNMNMYYSPVVVNYDFSAISPLITIPENAGDLTVSQFLQIYQYSVSTEECEISIIVDGDETVVWNYSCINGDWGIEGGEDISFSLADYAGEDIQVKFRTWGPTTDAWWGWYVYSMSISKFFDNELSAVEVTGPNNLYTNQMGTWDVEIKNIGLQPQSDFTVKLFDYKTGFELGSVNVTDVLNAGESGFYSFDWTPGSVYNTCLYGTVILEGDEFEGNNKTKGYFLRIETDVEYKVLVWDNDNNENAIINPETGQHEQCYVGLINALDDAGISYDLFTFLPTDLTQYDIIIATMGCYCLG